MSRDDSIKSAGKKFRAAVATNNPLQVVGTINAYCAIMAKKSGIKAIYLSGAGVANASYGLPDLGITSLNDVLADVERITNACDLPLLVDADTGWGGAFNIAKTVKQMIKYNAAAIHIEDQVSAKRCGHRPGKALVSTDEMVDRVKSAVDAKTDPDFVIMARTDCFQKDGIEAVVERANRYIEAGADMIFAEALPDLKDFRYVVERCPVPILANITEFGRTPLLSLEELHQAGIKLALYPLSAFRAMNNAALAVYQQITASGSQKKILDTMQTRDELYQFLDYHQYEQKLNKLFGNNKNN